MNPVNLQFDRAPSTIKKTSAELLDPISTLNSFWSCFRILKLLRNPMKLQTLLAWSNQHNEWIPWICILIVLQQEWEPSAELLDPISSVFSSIMQVAKGAFTPPLVINYERSLSSCKYILSPCGSGLIQILSPSWSTAAGIRVSLEYHSFGIRMKRERSRVRIPHTAHQLFPKKRKKERKKRKWPVHYMVPNVSLFEPGTSRVSP